MGDSREKIASPAGELLEILAHQIEASIADNNQAMASLIEAHGCIASQLPAQDAEAPVQQALSRMIIAFQEHDALNQRLEHVIEALQESRALLNDGETDPEQWAALEQRISSHYTTLQEQQVHDGKPITPATAPSDDIELF